MRWSSPPVVFPLGIHVGANIIHINKDGGVSLGKCCATLGYIPFIDHVISHPWALAHDSDNTAYEADDIRASDARVVTGLHRVSAESILRVPSTGMRVAACLTCCLTAMPFSGHTTVGPTGVFPRRGRLHEVAQPFHTLSFRPLFRLTVPHLALSSCNKELQPATRTPAFTVRPVVIKQREYRSLIGMWKAGERRQLRHQRMQIDTNLKSKTQPSFSSLSLLALSAVTPTRTLTLSPVC